MVKLSIKGKYLVIFFVIVMIVAVIGTLYSSLSKNKGPCPFECCIDEANYTDKECTTDYECRDKKCILTTYNLDGLKLKFRVDLREANNITVFPNEETISNIIWNQEIQNLTIVYMNSSNNSLVAIDAVEITYKLKLVYLNLNLDVGISGMLLNSYDNLTGTSENPIIALMPPDFSNETLVKAENYVIYIKGKTPEDFDLATAKFIMSALNINVG